MGYIRVSTEEQGDSGLGLEAQRSVIAAEIQHRNQRYHSRGQRWELEDIASDIVSGSVPWDDRAGLQEAMEALDRGDADLLMVSRLDRLTRSVRDFQNILAEAHSSGWGLIACDMDVDTTTANGRLLVNIMVSFAEFERELISERTRAALAARRLAGFHHGREPVIPLEVRQRIIAEREAGRSTRQIARGLTEDGVPTSIGLTKWWPSSVSKIVKKGLPE